jgi:hypothetical protein
VGIEYMAAIRKDDYHVFRLIITTELPAKYEVWLQIVKRRKLKAFQERGITVHDIEISPIEFGNRCKKMESADFSITSLDQCARAKALAQASVKCEPPRKPAPVPVGRKRGRWERLDEASPVWPAMTITEIGQRALAEARG